MRDELPYCGKCGISHEGDVCPEVPAGRIHGYVKGDQETLCGLKITGAMNQWGHKLAADGGPITEYSGMETHAECVTERARLGEGEIGWAER